MFSNIFFLLTVAFKTGWKTAKAGIVSQKSLNDESNIGQYYCMYFDKDHYWGWLLKIELQLVFKRTGSLK